MDVQMRAQVTDGRVGSQGNYLHLYALRSIIRLFIKRTCIRMSINAALIGVSTEHSGLRVPFVDLKAQYKSIEKEIQDGIQNVLQSASFVGGPLVDGFEEEFATYIGCKHAIGVASGTAALELALKASGVGQGNDVIVPANSFFATAEAVSNVGARPVFADVNERTFCLDVGSAEAVLTPQTRALIPVHLYGRAMDMSPVEKFAERHALAIVVDAAQAHGSARSGIRVGGSGHLTCFSFYPGKNLGAYGEAGAVTCDSAEEAYKIRLLREHGSPMKYQHSLVGTNARLDSLQAAVLSIKLRHLEEWNSMRMKHAGMYAERLAGSAILLPEIPPPGEHNFHLFVIRTPERDALREFLLARGISTGIHYPVPIHLTKAYQDLGYPGHGTLPVAERLSHEILSLPMYAELSAEQIERVSDAVLAFQGTGRRNRTSPEREGPIAVLF
jgi:dTDP-3-amino-3,4,6-trideoxy-alpha-D-glucose transaminase